MTAFEISDAVCWKFVLFEFLYRVYVVAMKICIYLHVKWRWCGEKLFRNDVIWYLRISLFSECCVYTCNFSLKPVSQCSCVECVVTTTKKESDMIVFHMKSGTPAHIWILYHSLWFLLFFLCVSIDEIFVGFIVCWHSLLLGRFEIGLMFRQTSKHIFGFSGFEKRTTFNK